MICVLAGHLHIIGYNLEKAPHLMYGVMDPQGKLVKRFPLPVEYKSMYHDFAITKNYVVIAQMPLVFDPQVGRGVWVLVEVDHGGEGVFLVFGGGGQGEGAGAEGMRDERRLVGGSGVWSNVGRTYKSVVIALMPLVFEPLVG